MAQNNKHFFDEMIAQREENQRRMDAIKMIVEDMVAKNINIDSALQVKMSVKNRTSYEVTEREVK